MKKFALPLLCCLLGVGAVSVRASDLSPEQIESLQERLEAIREKIDGHVSERNSGAGQRFAEAASDPGAAVELYLDCHELVNFEREGRPSSDFRAWEDNQSDRLREDAFVESLQMQLRYLALSCRAAESESIDSVFTPLVGYVDSLSRLEEMPADSLTESVANSVFAEAYHLEDLLGDNDGWEPVPFNIGGIYEKTILPYLRREKPEALMDAWDRRIEQQSRIVAMLSEHKEDQLRGLDRDEQRRARARQNSQGGLMGQLDESDYRKRTLPRLKWNKLKDMFRYVDQADAAAAMLDFLEEHHTHELGEQFFAEFNEVIADAGGEGEGEGESGNEGTGE